MNRNHFPFDFEKLWWKPRLVKASQLLFHAHRYELTVASKKRNTMEKITLALDCFALWQYRYIR